MKNLRVLYTLIVLFFVGSVNAQTTCVVTVNPLDTTICPGDSAFITASANLLGAGQAFDFNNAALPAGWNASGGTAFSAPCGPSPSNTPYYWASTTTSGNPGISTAGFDVTCGGVVTFDMVYAVQGGSAPCEGPDEGDEGVSLQYSIDGGVTWITIVYYSPGGYELPANPFTSGGVLPPGNITPYTSWSSFSVTIPPGALTTNTMFQWVQESPTSGTCCDNWGIENVVINATGPPCGSNTVINWSNGLMDTTSFYAVPTGDTTFVAYVYDSTGTNLQCISDTINVNVYDGIFNYTLPNTAGVYCPDDSALVEVTNVTNALLPMSYSWSTGSTTSSSYISANGVAPDTITYYVDITDGCGFTVTDSVDLTVVQYLSINSFNVTDQVNCTPNGAAQANVTGAIGAINYTWTDTAGNVISTSNPLTGVSTGWYYLDVTDNVCNTSDSVFVDSLFIDNLGYDLADTLTVFCPFDSIYAEVTNLTNAANPMTYSWSTGDTIAGSFLHAGANKHDTILYFVDFTDACGFTRSDTVVLVVNQLLTIDSLVMTPSTTCQGDGSAEAFYSGTNGTVNLQWETQQNWNNPGTGDSVDFNPWLMIGGGWHYFTVSDDLCQESDSILVEVLDPPVASFTASPASGCIGMDVTFTNNSQNTTQFYWDFGNGNDTLVNNMNSLSQNYYTSGQVMLIAYLDATQTCSDTAYLDISVVTCGCTDPLADNYNPLAVVDDGSCFYPTPEVIAPNVFTPNGDNNNDIYFFETINTVEFELLIMNRWGNVMYDVTLDEIDLQNKVGWDGTAPSGNDATEGTYFYKYTATGVNGDQVSGEGFLQLVRD